MMGISDVLHEWRHQRRMKIMGWNDRCTDPGQWCFNCPTLIEDYQEPHEDAAGNPICEKCWGKILDKAEAVGEGER